jgi:hypothetical protein
MLEIIQYCMFCLTRFASLSVGSGNEAPSCSPHVPHPVYGGGLASAMSHTYINQYTGSEYNLDKVQVRSLQLMAVRTSVIIPLTAFTVQSRFSIPAFSEVSYLANIFLVPVGALCK